MNEIFMLFVYETAVTVPCDPLKHWPPPTWLHQQCFWPFPSPELRCETEAPPPPEHIETNAQLIEAVFLYDWLCFICFLSFPSLHVCTPQELLSRRCLCRAC